MSTWELPRSATINGREFPIRSDYRAALDALSVLADPGLDDNERGVLTLTILYPDAADMDPTDHAEAIEFAKWFLAGGDGATKAPPVKLADWEQDFPIIVGPVNRVLGYECRAVPYDPDANEGGLHWWTFLAAYNEVGDCLFAQVVAIRKKIAQGRKLEKHEQRFYREHGDLVDLKRKETPEEERILEHWIS